MVDVQVRKNRIMSKIDGNTEEIAMELGMVIAGIYQAMAQRDPEEAKKLKKTLQMLLTGGSPVWSANIPNMVSIDVKDMAQEG